MDIDKELEAIFDDPLLKMSEEEESLFDIPQDMRRVIARRGRKPLRHTSGYATGDSQEET